MPSRYFFHTLTLIALLFALSPSHASVRTVEAASPTRATQSLTRPAPALTWPGQAFRFQRLDIEDGLSQNSITTILQDRQGFLWLGTEDGLNRYDGYEFIVFKPDAQNSHSLSDRRIQALFEDRDGILWVGTAQGGLNRYDPKTRQFGHFLHAGTDPTSLSSNSINTIYQDADGLLWIGTESGLDWLNPASGVITHVRRGEQDALSLGGNHVKKIFADSSSRIWVGTGAGELYLFAPLSKTFTRYPREVSGKDLLCAASILDIAQTSDGRLWLATTNGLARFDPLNEGAWCYRHSDFNSGSLSSDFVNSVYVDDSSRLWVGTDAGLDEFHSATNTFSHLKHSPEIPESLSAESVSFIYGDRGGVLWVGTNTNGVNKHDPAQERFAYYRHQAENLASLSDDFVFPICVQPNGRVWVGTYGGGLDEFIPATGGFRHFRSDPQNTSGLPNNYIWAIYSDSHNDLWVSTNRGLSKFNPNSERFTNYTFPSDDPDIVNPGLIYAMAEDASGALWLATRHGLGRFDREQGLFLPETFPDSASPSIDDRIVSLLIDRSGIIWFGTFDKGLYRYSPASRQLQNFRASSSAPGALNNNSITAIFEDEQQVIWVATAGGGLNRFDANTETFRAYTEAHGLPSNVIYGVMQDSQGNLWISTNSGISRFDLSASTFRNFNLNDGLGSMEFNIGSFAEAPNGDMFFGTTNGLNIFRPEQIEDSSYEPPLAITSITVDGKALQANPILDAITSIRMEHPQNSFEFEFVALGFIDSENNQYAYKLEGFDQDWNLLGARHSGRYTNLPGGEYNLLLKASNSDGVWGSELSAISVTVIPPYWQMTWFRLTSLLLVGAIAFVGYRLRVRSVETRNVHLEQLVRTRTAELEELFVQNKDLAILEERNRLARDLHDSAKQKAFAALAQLGTVNGLAKDHPLAHKHLVEAETLVAEVIQELTFLIQEMYPINLMEKGLATTLREYVFEWENRTGIEADVSIQSPLPLDLKIEQAVYRIIQESLANVARHSQATRVRLDLEYAPAGLRILVADNGHGFDVAHKALGLGMRSMRERVESIAGTLKFESGPEVGTSVLAEIPIVLKTEENKL